MIEVLQDKQLPKWTLDYIPTTCEYCGSPIVSNHDTGVLTSLWCSNPYCSGHLAHRMVYVAKYYDIKGLGPVKYREWLERNGSVCHLDVLSTWFNEKPTEPLSRIVDLACIRDVGITSVAPVLDKYASFDEFFESDDCERFPELCEVEPDLEYMETFFNVKKPMKGKTLFVMATGSIHGFPNRDKFFDELNNKFGDRVHIIQTGARKTGVACLIKE